MLNLSVKTMFSGGSRGLRCVLTLVALIISVSTFEAHSLSVNPRPNLPDVTTLQQANPGIDNLIAVALQSVKGVKSMSHALAKSSCTLSVLGRIPKIAAASQALKNDKYPRWLKILIGIGVIIAIIVGVISSIADICDKNDEIKNRRNEKK